MSGAVSPMVTSEAPATPTSKRGIAGEARSTSSEGGPEAPPGGNRAQRNEPAMSPGTTTRAAQVAPPVVTTVRLHRHRWPRPSPPRPAGRAIPARLGRLREARRRLRQSPERHPTAPRPVAGHSLRRSLGREARGRAQAAPPPRHRASRAIRTPSGLSWAHDRAARRPPPPASRAGRLCGDAVFLQAGASPTSAARCGGGGGGSSVPR